VHEALDPRFQQHLLPGAVEGAYVTDPPTSGAHRPGLPTANVLRAPLDRPTQVGALEAGAVVVQYRDAGGGTRRAIERLAGHLVYVAPNPSLPARVVATAWRWKLACDGVDDDALRAFVREHRGRTPDP
jgi:hypothetical protein